MKHRYQEGGRDRVEGRGPVDIKLENAAIFQKWANEKTREPYWYRDEYGRSHMSYREVYLYSEAERRRLLQRAEESLASALKDEAEIEAGVVHTGANPSRPFRASAGGPSSRRQQKRHGHRRG